MTEKERKRRRAELVAELKALDATPKSDWHAGFEALLRIEAYKYGDKIQIRTEEEIGVMPPRTDFIILVAEDGLELEKDIFRIFKKINILEYKNPNDTLNLQVIRKVLGYANLYIGVAEHEKDRPDDQVTISIFRAKKNVKLFSKMEQEGALIKSDVPGVYYVKGLTDLPFQIVITDELQGEEYAAYRSLSVKVKDTDFDSLIISGGKETSDVCREYYRNLINLIINKNPQFIDRIKEAIGMEDVLMEIVRDRVEREKNEAAEEATKIATQNATQNTNLDHIKDIMKKLRYTLDQAMDLLSIPADQREMYTGLIKGSK